MKNPLKISMPENVPNPNEHRIPPTGEQSSPETVTNSDVSAQNQTVPAAPEKKIVKPSETLIKWEAPSRMFKAQPREFFRRLAVIFIFFAFLFLIIFDFIMVALLAVIYFAIYAYSSVPPDKIVHQITTNGIRYASDYLYNWEALDSFFIEKKDNTKILYVNTVEALPGRLILLLNNEIDTAKLSEIVNQYISIIENPQKGFYDDVLEKIKSRINI